MTTKNKEKIPSQFNSLLSHINLINTPLFINLSIRRSGRAENRTRNFCVTDSCFTIKLLAHNSKSILNYLNFDIK